MPSDKTVSIPNGDGRVNSRIANYTAFFDKDAAHDGEEHKQNRLDNYTDVVNGQFAPCAQEQNCALTIWHVERFLS